MELNEWIRAARKKAELTQERLGELLGVTKGNISAWEKGRHEPSYAQLQRVSEISGMPLPAVDQKHESGARDASNSELNGSLFKEFLTQRGNRITSETSGDFGAANVSVPQGGRGIPLLSYKQASNMSAALDPFTLGEGLKTITEYKEVSAAAFAIVIEGPSMLPVFEPGDIVSIDPARRPKPSRYVLARTHTGEATFRKYRELGTNAQGEMVFELVPLNNDFATLHSERDQLVVIGAMRSHTNFDPDD